jgi:hypothetical protein
MHMEKRLYQQHIFLNGGKGVSKGGAEAEFGSRPGSPRIAKWIKNGEKLRTLMQNDQCLLE